MYLNSTLSEASRTYPNEDSIRENELALFHLTAEWSTPKPLICRSIKPASPSTALTASIGTAKSNVYSPAFSVTLSPPLTPAVFNTAVVAPLPDTRPVTAKCTNASLAKPFNAVSNESIEASASASFASTSV